MNTSGHAQQTSPRTIALLNQKGGVGKTTTTVNLGAALARTGQRVLLIDLDPQAHLTLHLGIDEQTVDRTVYDLMLDDECPVEEALINARENLDVILAEVDLAAAEQELVQMPDRQSRLRNKIEPIAHRYDFILLDCPPSLGLLTVNAMTMAREIFVPMQAHFLALQGVGRLLETVGQVCKSVNPDLRVTGIILCMYDGQTTLAREVVADLDDFFRRARDHHLPWSDCRVLRPPIRRNIKLAEAPSFGQTIFDYEPWCPGALDYRKLASRLVRQAAPQLTSTSSPPERVSDEPVEAVEAVEVDESVVDVLVEPKTLEAQPEPPRLTPEEQAEADELAELEAAMAAYEASLLAEADAVETPLTGNDSTQTDESPGEIVLASDPANELLRTPPGGGAFAADRSGMVEVLARQSDLDENAAESDESHEPALAFGD